MKVYIDDLFVKSREPEGHIDDLRESFEKMG